MGTLFSMVGQCKYKFIDNVNHAKSTFTSSDGCLESENKLIGSPYQGHFNNGC